MKNDKPKTRHVCGGDCMCPLSYNAAIKTYGAYDNIPFSVRPITKKVEK